MAMVGQANHCIQQHVALAQLLLGARVQARYRGGRGPLTKKWYSGSIADVDWNGGIAKITTADGVARRYHRNS